jgi:hypothetical protein
MRIGMSELSKKEIKNEGIINLRKKEQINA